MWLQERLDAQKKEADENPDYNKSFKAQASKEEKQAKRKQIISTIGACPTASQPLTSSPQALKYQCSRSQICKNLRLHAQQLPDITMLLSHNGTPPSGG